MLQMIFEQEDSRTHFDPGLQFRGHIKNTVRVCFDEENDVDENEKCELESGIRNPTKLMCEA